jgi:hypothetical protein
MYMVSRKSVTLPGFKLGEVDVEKVASSHIFEKLWIGAC